VQNVKGVAALKGIAGSVGKGYTLGQWARGVVREWRSLGGVWGGGFRRD
jgi:hypothetical protein